MKCARVERLLPLCGGDDLEGRHRKDIEEHLPACESCRRLERDLRRTRAWIASVPGPALGEAGSAQLRREVWQEIESRGLRAGRRVERDRRWAVSSAAALLAAVIVGLAVLSKGRSGPAGPPPAAAVPAATEQRAAAAPPRNVEESAAPEPGSTKARLPRLRGGRHSGAARTETVRIEFQTANPDVRIIWLVKKEAEKPSAGASRNQEVS